MKTNAILKVKISCKELIKLMIIAFFTIVSNSAYAACAVPGNITATAATSITCTSLQANWDLPGGTINNYYIDLSINNFTSSVAGYPKFTGSTNLFYAVTGIDGSNPNYYYRVKAYNAGSGGCLSAAWSNIITAVMPAGCYCPSTNSFTTYYLTNVTFGSINNNTTNTCGSMYCDYTAQSTAVVPNSSYDMTVTVTNGANPTFVYAWFDWDQNGVFANDATERYLIGNPGAGGPTTVGPISILVPAGATTGTTIMRLNNQRFDDAVNPCSPHASNYGETEDYTITICSPPAITGQPVNPASVCFGTGTPSFTVTATGDGLTYQWQEYISSWINVSDGGYYSGATTTTLTITNPIYAMNGYNYRCVVTGTCGTATSNGVAALTVDPATSVTGEPSNAIACADASTPNFTVSVSGSGLSYQWEEYISGWITVSDGGVYSGATTATLTITNPPLGMNSYKYRCTATGTCGAATSDGLATLTVVNPVLSITVHPNDETVCQNANIDFTITALGSIFQWQVNTGAGWSNITAAGSSPAYSNWTTSTLSLTGTDNPSGYQYRCLAGCNQLASNAATLTVIPPSDPTPTGASRCGTGTLNLSATGAISGEVFKWYDAITGGTLLKTSTDETDNTYTTPSISVTTNYYITIFRTAGGCESFPRTLVVATINTPVSISAHPADQVICTGDNAVFSVTATGTSLTYQWRKGGVNLSDGGQISGATTASVTISSATPANDGNYDCVCTGTCNTLTSNTALLDADPTQANAGNDQLITTTSTTLAGNLPVTGTGTWTLISGPNTPNIVNANLYNTQIGTTTGLLIGTYVYRWTIVLGGCTDFDEVEISRYCIGTYTNDCAGSADVYIANVYVSDIDNSSSCSGGATQNYTNYTNIIGSVEAGYSYPITLTHGGSTNQTWLGIWVDWNKDGDFLDANEFMSPINCPAGVAYNTGWLDVPVGTAEGNYYMRIRAKFSTTMTQATVCDNYTYGETEDYTLKVVPATCFNSVLDVAQGETEIDCGGSCFTPVAGTITGGGSYACGSQVILTSSAQGAVQWQYSLTGGDPWYDVAGETTYSYSPSLTQSRSFRVEVSGGNCTPIYSSPVTVTITGTVTNTWLTTGTTSWTTATNWSQGVVPVACHNVIIPAGGNQPTVAPAGSIECNDITIDVSATLTLNYNQTRTFQIWGNILNNGTVNSTNTGKWTLRGTLTTWGGTGSYTGTMYIFIGDESDVTLTNNVNVYSVQMTSTEPYGKLSLDNNTLLITNEVDQSASSIYVNTGILDLAITTTMILNPNSLYPEYGTVIFRGAANFSITGIWDQVGGTGFYNVEFRPPPTYTYTIGSNQLARNWFKVSGNIVRCQNAGGSPTPPYTIRVAGDFINDATTFTNTADVTFIMDGSAAQNITGANASTFNKLTINNTSSTGVTLLKPVTVAGALTLTDGYLYTDATNLLTLNDNATSTSGSTASFVDGPMKKIGNDVFVFPLGDVTKWARLGITAPTTATTQYTVEYFAHNPTTDGYTSINLAAGPPTLNNVSVLEYWTLAQAVTTEDVQVTLYWEDAPWSGINDCDGDPDDLRIAHWNSTNSNWEIGVDAVALTGTCGTNGTIQTSSNQPDYSPFTFSSKAIAVNPLPVELLSFEAICDDNIVKLLWSTASEMNNDYFTIERSSDRTNFIPIKTVKGAGNSNLLINYSSTDDKPLKGFAYYRLKQTDFDGSFKYSKVIVTCNGILDNNKININLYPNPAQEGQSVYLEIDGLKDKEILVVVNNTLGQQLFSKIVISNTNGVVIEAIDSQSRLPPGVYYIIASSNSNLFNRKLVIK